MDAATIYLPVILMGVLALGTYWLARNTPTFSAPEAKRPPTHQPDYFMRGFSVKSFGPNGRLRSELHGSEARHFPDTDTLEIDNVRIRSYNERGALTVATAKKAVTNADGSQVQLIGDAVVTREDAKQANGTAAPKLEIRGEFLHAFLDTERVKSDQPVVLKRGDDQFTADSLAYDNLDRVLELRGRVRGTIAPQQ
ncbi:LPS export ABC transporter periplasmic protein LptC [Ramlibacter albus]|uniref:LPS export ABC transporter periplasmic protein LptC n=1 Tax=Ramlibacter albus TaxID=2079448 RepID=A0A923M4D9_9BURK|nr:LPS export ABC transporter periplasmic protein LptC [Ramlibacter albus]MBC5763740.1 LPS export ABC transporter periplasmic protein LptC [Ramlibacter albus]